MFCGYILCFLLIQYIKYFLDPPRQPNGEILQYILFKRKPTICPTRFAVIYYLFTLMSLMFRFIYYVIFGLGYMLSSIGCYWLTYSTISNKSLFFFRPPPVKLCTYIECPLAQDLCGTSCFDPRTKVAALT